VFPVLPNEIGRFHALPEYIYLKFFHHQTGGGSMRVNYKGNKMRKEAARKQEQEAKRNKRLHRNNENPPAPSEAGIPPAAGTNPPAL